MILNVRTRNSFISGILITVLFLGFSLEYINAQDPVILKPSTIDAIKARHIGPATMSGRITSIDAIDSRPIILYVGTASGGLWKSANGGVKFKPIFDDYTQSIGAIRIDPLHPDTVWVGTGEPWTRNSVSIGEGIFKTTDAGESWTRMGLEKTERIGRIVIHPENTDIVYVAALGPLWNDSEERGIFKTTDGGKTWEKVFYINQSTGCSDIDIDPSNPDILYAGMWDFRRQPWTFRSGGPGSGLYKSTDGGTTWQKLSKNLPQGETGRVSVSVSPVTPNIVYALIESKESALYLSEDHGASWIEINNTVPIKERPFYFSQLYADPVDTNRVYKPSFNLNVSDNKGKNFRTAYIAGGNVHPDHHAFWISKRNNNILYLGTDGGVYLSTDKGSSFALLRNLPVSQFYHVAVDMENPYNVYGGLQDNGSWYAPSEKVGGITNADWKGIGFGDGFAVIPDKFDTDIIYWQFQGGMFFRYHKSTGDIKFLKPVKDSGTEDLRFNWNAGIHQSPARNVLYVGAQYLYQSKNNGDTWTRISPDLTTDDPSKQEQYKTGGLTVDNSAAENHCSIYTIAESPKDQKVIWVGTDDGNLQITRDEGATWTNVTPNIKDLPANTWVSQVSTSPFEAGTAYATFDGHRHGDMKSHAFKTDDYGATWRTLETEDVEGYCHSIVQDFVNPDLLFLGTELGLYVSFNDGQSWTRMQGNIPRASVREIVIHPRDHDLVLATHGRGILIVDDITPLRQVTPDLLEKDVALLKSQPFVLGKLSIPQDFSGDDEFTGQSAPDAATITYYLKKRHIFGDMHIEIFDAEGNFVVELPASKRKGLNRVAWTVMKKPPKVPSSPSMAQFAMFGPFFDPGVYTVKLIKNSDAYEGTVELRLDPDSPYSDEDRMIRIKTINQGYKMLEDLAFTDAKAVNIMKDARKLAEETKGATRKQLIQLADRLEEMHQEMVETKVGGISGEEKLRGKIAILYATPILFQGRPTDSQINGLNDLKKEVDAMEQKLDETFNKTLPKLNQTLQKQGKKPLTILTKEEFEKSDSN